MVQEIQYATLEAPNGISGYGMSGQLSITSILNAIQRAVNRFFIDARFPVTVNSQTYDPPPSQGEISLAQSTVYLHRAAWQDIPSLAWTNLWREDAWSLDHSNPLWTTSPDTPIAYSESEGSPLFLQLYPPPANEGALETITVNSFLIDTTNANATFQIPDEWVHAVKYQALTILFASDSQLNDPLRAQYCAMRYQQAMGFANKARSLLRLLLNGSPLAIDSLAALDSSTPYWRNQTGPPQMAGTLYDLIAVSPGQPDSAYGIAADVVQSAPLPAAGAGGYIQLGEEDIATLTDYAIHILLLKCGGTEFQNTFDRYDSFMRAVSGRGAINAAEIKYLSALFGQPMKDDESRPDTVGSKT